jgi:hypothetical protein
LYVENRLDRKPKKGFLNGLLRYARTSLFPTAYGLKLKMPVKDNNTENSIFWWVLRLKKF